MVGFQEQLQQRTQVEAADEGRGELETRLEALEEGVAWNEDRVGERIDEIKLELASLTKTFVKVKEPECGRKTLGEIDLEDVLSRLDSAADCDAGIMERLDDIEARMNAVAVPSTGQPAAAGPSSGAGHVSSGGYGPYGNGQVGAYQQQAPQAPQCSYPVLNANANVQYGGGGSYAGLAATAVVRTESLVPWLACRTAWE